jgi:hypothetical protein
VPFITSLIVQPFLQYLAEIVTPQKMFSVQYTGVNQKHNFKTLYSGVFNPLEICRGMPFAGLIAIIAIVILLEGWFFFNIYWQPIKKIHFLSF